MKTIISKLRSSRRLQAILYPHCQSISQAGQDYWVYAEAFNRKKRGFFVDVGAHDGVFLSNTFVLERRLKWQGICIEANPTTFAILRRKRKANCFNCAASEQAGEIRFIPDDVDGRIAGEKESNSRVAISIPCKPLNEILEMAEAPRLVDYMSVDVEGAEDRVFDGLSLDQFTFRTMTIERPSQSLRKKLSKAGYAVVKEIPGLDVFYVHETFMTEFASNTMGFHTGKRIGIRVL